MEKGKCQKDKKPDQRPKTTKWLSIKGENCALIGGL